MKAALRRAGIPFRSVKHGTGTAAGWLKIKLTATYEEERANGFKTERAAISVAQLATGRHGEYDGRINTFLAL